MELASLVTITGASVLVVILEEAIKRAFAFSAAQVDRFGLLLALILGLVVTIPTAIYIGSDPGAAVLAGLLAGASATGIYQGAAKSPLPTYSPAA